VTTRIVVIGAGGFGRETLDVIEALNGSDRGHYVDGVVDDSPSESNLNRLAARGIRYLGDVEAWLADGAQSNYVIGIGNPGVRRRIAMRLDEAGAQATTLIHPHADIGAITELGPGTVVCAGVRITTNIHIGSHVHLNLNATVGHDTVLSDFVTVNPLAAVSGDCVIGAEVLLGSGCVVLQGITVGNGASVGASACVTRDVAAGTVVKGVPAR
jgi:hypothetical protein